VRFRGPFVPGIHPSYPRHYYRPGTQPAALYRRGTCLCRVRQTGFAASDKLPSRDVLRGTVGQYPLTRPFRQFTIPCYAPVYPAILLCLQRAVDFVMMFCYAIA